MDEALRVLAHYVAWLTEAIAILAIAIGAFEALFGIVHALLLHRHGPGAGAERRAVWMRFARWLVAALTFQLAADIVSTSTAPTWPELGRLAAIAMIRTFLSYFLDREVDSNRALQDSRDRSGKPDTPVA
jgi:uncharacterized membrane protein